MATQTPAFVLNENVHIPRGKGVDGVKPNLLKPEKKAGKERKALADLSNTGKPVFPGAPKGSTLKEKSFLHGSKTTKKAAKSSSLTDEEIKKCHEWAREGIEQTHFTGNDLHDLDKDILEKRVKKKVDMVMSCLSKWTQMAYDHGMPAKKITEDIEDIMEMKLEPEVLLPIVSSLPTSGDEGEDPFLEAELHMFPPLDDHMLELKLKVEYEG